MSLPHRFICPHCHTPIDPIRMEPARHGVQEYRICPECDEAIAVAVVANESPPNAGSAASVNATCPA